MSPKPPIRRQRLGIPASTVPDWLRSGEVSTRPEKDGAVWCWFYGRKPPRNSKSEVLGRFHVSKKLVFVFVFAFQERNLDLKVIIMAPSISFSYL